MFQEEFEKNKYRMNYNHSLTHLEQKALLLSIIPAGSFSIYCPQQGEGFPLRSEARTDCEIVHIYSR